MGSVAGVLDLVREDSGRHTVRAAAARINENHSPFERGIPMRRLALFGLFLVGPLAGCDRADGDRLARAGRRAALNVQALVPERTPFADAINLPKNATAVERVRARFQSDRSLGSLAIEIAGSDGVVRLKGQIADQAIRQRAIDMAEATVGVEKVIDELAP
jgi:hyperosmotically inducible periplasmic protein